METFYFTNKEGRDKVKQQKATFFMELWPLLKLTLWFRIPNLTLAGSSQSGEGIRWKLRCNVSFWYICHSRERGRDPNEAISGTPIFYVLYSVQYTIMIRLLYKCLWEKLMPFINSCRCNNSVIILGFRIFLLKNTRYPPKTSSSCNKIWNMECLILRGFHYEALPTLPN